MLEERRSFPQGDVIPTPEIWAFIAGCNNSGTTLLKDLLSEHPDIGSLPAEGQLLTDQLVLPRQVGASRLWTTKLEYFRFAPTDQQPDADEIKKQWAHYFNDLERPVLLEKSPSNAVRTLWLQEHFPNAHFIGIIRNGYAVAEGIRRRRGHSIERCAQHWSDANSIMLGDFTHIKNKLIIRYEELVTDPQVTLKNIFAFLKLDPNKVNFWEVCHKEWEIHDYRPHQVQNMNESAIARLTPEDIAAINCHAGKMLNHLKYATSV